MDRTTGTKGTSTSSSSSPSGSGSSRSGSICVPGRRRRTRTTCPSAASRRTRSNPDAWRPRTPNGAFLNARDDDTFWAARRVMAFTDEMLRAVVTAGGFSDPAAERHLADMLIARRDRIGAAYLPRINPLVDFTLGPDGVLAFANAAVDAGVAVAPGGYRAAWAELRQPRRGIPFPGGRHPVVRHAHRGARRAALTAGRVRPHRGEGRGPAARRVDPARARLLQARRRRLDAGRSGTPAGVARRTAPPAGQPAGRPFKRGGGDDFRAGPDGRRSGPPISVNADGRAPAEGLHVPERSLQDIEA